MLTTGPSKATTSTSITTAAEEATASRVGVSGAKASVASGGPAEC